MKMKKIAFVFIAVVVATTFVWPNRGFAHCDGLDGAVVKAAQRALDSGNVNPVLIWVQKSDEAKIRGLFEKTLAVRKLNTQARELADMYFFETLVRIHRAGEGAPTRDSNRPDAISDPLFPPRTKRLRAVKSKLS